MYLTIGGILGHILFFSLFILFFVKRFRNNIIDILEDTFLGELLSSMKGDIDFGKAMFFTLGFIIYLLFILFISFLFIGLWGIVVPFLTISYIIFKLNKNKN